MRKAGLLLLLAACFPLAILVALTIGAWFAVGVAVYGYAKTAADIWSGP